MLVVSVASRFCWLLLSFTPPPCGASDKSASAVTIEPAVNQFGKSIYEMKFLGIPVRIVDALTVTESAVS